MSEPEFARNASAGPRRAEFSGWIEAFENVARTYRVPFSTGGVRQFADALADDGIANVERLAARFGLRIRVSPPSAQLISSPRLPIIVRMKDGAFGVVTAVSADRQVSVAFCGEAGSPTRLALAGLIDDSEIFVVARPARAAPDARVDAYIAPYREHWFRRIVLSDAGAYGHIVLASFVANVLTLEGVTFSMQVYDRVVPANSYETLYVLFAGVMLAVGFEFAMRRVRTSIIDAAGKRADVRTSDLVFGHALRVRNQARPTSTGTFIAQLRDLEQVRELLTSTTLVAVADLPFFVLFMVLFCIIGGQLALVPATALIVLILPGILAQRRLRACANEAMRESSLRNAILVEAVQGLEDIKSLQAEDQFQRRWNHFNTVAADAQLRLRRITSGLSAWSQGVQTATYATVIFIGAPLVMSGDMTTGALVACSILGSRMIAPMGQLSQVLGRFQQAKIGMRSLNSIMRLPVDHPDAGTRVEASHLDGAYSIRDAKFHYSEASGRPALTVDRFRIEAGEHCALIGKNGAGKSTLLLALAGMIEPATGEVLLDNLALNQIDPTDVRRNVGLVTQNSRLFHGTIRENVLMGAPHADQAKMLDALAMVGADDFIARLPLGLDHPILEGGRGLSGGQQQALLLARLLLRDPAIVLLDEPTAAMDEATERKFITGFQQWSATKTVIVATHRMRVLDLVGRVVAVDNGRIVLDEGKDNALKRLRGVEKVNIGSPGQSDSSATPSSELRMQAGLGG